MAWATPRTWSAGEHPTAAQFNQDIRDNTLAAFPLGVDAWAAWTPTLTNLTLGNGTVTAKYQRVGRTVFFKFKFLLGSTSAVGTAPNFSLPTTPATDNDTLDGVVLLVEAGVQTRSGLLVRSVAVAVIRYWNAEVATSVSATAPFTWGTADEIHATGCYESTT